MKRVTISIVHMIQGSHLGPGNYNFESFTDEMAKKVTSLRGPYDLFSGDRNKAVKTGHYVSPVSVSKHRSLIYIFIFVWNAIPIFFNKLGNFSTSLST